ncbi:MAG TPA: MBL fold metallo-hydrolase [Solirubrobacteraceae bacterium]
MSRLKGGELVLQSRLWATNSVVVPAGEDACLVCDPSIFPDEIAEIRALTDGSARVYVLVTHSDFDHVCGLPAFAGATVVTGVSTAAAIAGGAARRKLDESGREWGAAWDGELRVDVTVSAEAVWCGDLEIAAVECQGHCDDGAGFVIAGRGLLLAGDYLSTVSPPIVLGSFDGAVSAIERLLRTIDAHRIPTIVPGHGPVLDRDQAHQVGREDIRYLRAVQAAAAAAVRAGESANVAFLRVRGVPAPRAARSDFEAFDWLSANARRALADAGHRSTP